jgi:hypothetical protein
MSGAYETGMNPGQSNQTVERLQPLSNSLTFEPLGNGMPAKRIKDVFSRLVRDTTGRYGVSSQCKSGICLLFECLFLFQFTSLVAFVFMLFIRHESCE